MEICPFINWDSVVVKNQTAPISDLRLDRLVGVPGRIRTRDPLLRRQPLYPLSYWDMVTDASTILAGPWPVKLCRRPVGGRSGSCRSLRKAQAEKAVDTL